MTPKDIAQAPKLVSTACSLGWNVFSAPLCNKEGYPVLKSMYEVVMEVRIVTMVSEILVYSNVHSIINTNILNLLVLKNYILIKT